MKRAVAITLIVGVMLTASSRGQDAESERVQRVNAWIEKLADPNDKVRFDTSNALINFAGNPTEGLITALTNCLRDKFHLVRANCAIGLSRAGEKAAPALTELTAVLGDRSALVRGWAARAIGRIGPKAKPALAKLGGLLRDTDVAARRGAAMAIVDLEPSGATAAVPVLVGDLRFVHVDRTIQDAVRNEIAATLEKLAGPAAAAAVNELKPLLNDEDAGVRWRAKEITDVLRGK